MALLKLRSAKSTLEKSPIFEESRLSKQDFTTRVNELSNRFNYHNDHQSTKERFMQAVKRYGRHSK